MIKGPLVGQQACVTYSCMGGKNHVGMEGLQSGNDTYLEGIGGSRRGLRGLQHFKFQNKKKVIKQSKKIEDNSLEKEEERKSCVFV